ncbi:MAG TPA: hypothetical protein VGM81_13710 [Burkholderiaceae bacterium]|jgi:hypothetical protein
MTTATFAANLDKAQAPNDTAPDLHRHLQQCDSARGRWFGAAMLAERVHGMVAPRFATTVACAAVLLLLVCR